jgi:sugar/nucleoside kinase (ribokinase family)
MTVAQNPTSDETAGQSLGPPLLFGEILYDRMPDGQERLGGAPLNLAWSLVGLGYSPILISRLGRDARGDRALAALTEWGLETRGIQRDETLPTGLVTVYQEAHEPRFSIPLEQGPSTPSTRPKPAPPSTAPASSTTARWRPGTLAPAPRSAPCAKKSRPRALSI